MASEPEGEQNVAAQVSAQYGAENTEFDGIGTAPATTIATLPPIDELPGTLTLSEKTGEPKRTRVIVASQVALYGAAGLSGIGYAWYWWHAMHVEMFAQSAWVVGWLNPRPGSAGSVWLVIGLAVAIALMVAAPCVAAYQAWTGWRFARTLTIIASCISLLGALFNPMTLMAIPLCITGLVILRTRAASEYFDQWDAFRSPAVADSEHSGAVFYGRLPRFE